MSDTSDRDGTDSGARLDPDNLKRLAQAAKDAPVGKRDGGRAHAVFRDATTPDVVLELVEKALAANYWRDAYDAQNARASATCDALRERVATLEADRDALTARLAPLDALRQQQAQADAYLDHVAERREVGEAGKT